MLIEPSYHPRESQVVAGWRGLWIRRRPGMARPDAPVELGGNRAGTMVPASWKRTSLMIELPPSRRARVFSSAAKIDYLAGSFRVRHDRSRSARISSAHAGLTRSSLICGRRDVATCGSSFRLPQSPPDIGRPAGVRSKWSIRYAKKKQGRDTVISDTTAGSGDGDRTVKADFLQLAASPDAVRQARRLVRTRPAE